MMGKGIGSKYILTRLFATDYFYSTSTNNYSTWFRNLWYEAQPGYYLKDQVTYNHGYWNTVGTCTNKPANAHYTGAGTPDTDGGPVDVNDCPWVCDDGYYGKSENGDTSCTLCPAGYACTNGVQTKCSGRTSNGRLTYSNAGASSCTECPAVQSALESRMISYNGWWLNDIRNSINGCAVNFNSDTPDATFSIYCYYDSTDGIYGGPNARCEPHAPTACAAGKYSIIDQHSTWNGSYMYCKGMDCGNNVVCGDVGSGYYSPDGDTARYACDTKPANSHFTCSGTTNDHPWECDDAGAREYGGVCHSRCTHGRTKLHIGHYTHPLWADRTNVASPVLAVGDLGENGDGVCYVYLEPDVPGKASHGFHTTYNNAPYHAINLGVVLLPPYILPAGYTRLEYIVADGHARINTGVTGLDSGDWDIYAKWMLTGAPVNDYGCVVGTYSGESYNSYRIITVLKSTDQYYVNGNARSGNGSIQVYSIAANQIHEGIISNGAVTIDGVTTPTTIQGDPVVSSTPIYIFNSGFVGRMYESYAAKDGVVQYQMFPVKRTSDNAVGMYDMVSQTFFTSSGTHQFTAGPEL